MATDYEITSKLAKNMQAKFVLCLDHIAESEGLTLLMGSTETEEQETFAKQVLGLLKKTAKDVNTKIGFEKKISAGNFYEWEHLRFSERAMTAATLTSLKTRKFSHKYDKLSVFDTLEAFDKAAYEKNSKLIAEFLLRLVFDLTESESTYLTSDLNLI